MGADVLAEDQRVLYLRPPRADVEDGPPPGIATVIGLGRRSAELGELDQMATPVGGQERTARPSSRCCVSALLQIFP
jgi:hypothetical protein